MQKVGGWSFTIGIVIAIIISLMVVFGGGTAPTWAILSLAVLGLVAGVLNIDPKEVQIFLLASIAFLISFTSLANVAALVPAIGAGFATFFTLMAVFVAPAAAVVAIVAILYLIKN